MTSRFFTSSTLESQGSLRGGILLRTLRRVSDGKLFSGPSLLVDELLRLSNANNLAELVNEHWKNDIDAFASAPSKAPSLRLHALDVPRVTTGQPEAIYKSPRIGLELSHPSIPLPEAGDVRRTLEHPRTIFVSRHYRHFVRPALLTSNGRGHTLLGVLHHLTSNKHELPSKSDKELQASLISLTGLKASTAEKYLDEYRNAMSPSGGNLKGFIGSRGKGAGSSPISFLRMLGCLERLQTRC